MSAHTHKLNTRDDVCIDVDTLDVRILDLLRSAKEFT